MTKYRGATVLGLALAIVAVSATAAEADGECRTYERWLEKQQLATAHGPGEASADAEGNGGAGGLPGGGSGCPQLGVCDQPPVRDSYIPGPAPALLNIRMKLNVFAEDDGTNPATTQNEIDLQMAQLNGDFAPLGIQFLPEVEFINDSQYRSWASSEEFGMKMTYADEPDHKLNVYVVFVEGAFSVATFPWDSSALDFLGGIVMNEFQWGPTRTTLSHEVGHCLGLWHTHHGVSEVNTCGACWESADGSFGDVTGDFCSDTDPTPTNFACLPPPGSDVCSGLPWNQGSTDYQNFMGYGPSSCRNFFSEQQQGRSRCWFADRLTGWLAEPPGLNFEYPLGLPTFVTPALTEIFQVQVVADIGVDAELGTAQGFSRVNGGNFQPITMVHLGDNLYEVQLKAPNTCGGLVEFYFTADTTEPVTHTDPPTAPDELYAARAAYGDRVVYDDGFELDVSGWSIVNDASLTSGAWEQADPIGTTWASMPAAPGSVSDPTDVQNALVFVTENGLAGGTADEADVDGGPTDLISPVFDLTGHDGLVSYNRWFFSDGADTLEVSITDDGTNWVLVESVDGDQNSWQTASFRVADHVTPNATLQVRFRTSDAPDDSVTEAAIDNFRVTELRCTACTQASDCTDVLFCDGAEACNGGFCEAGGVDPCPLLCDELVDTCVECFLDDDCDDDLYCNGPEICTANTCGPGPEPCPVLPCDDGFDVCIECLIDVECDDGVFCNGQEICFAPGVCGLGNPACPGLCNETNETCIGAVPPPPRPGDALVDLSPNELDRYVEGLASFETPLSESDGLGPAYNATSCASCHNSYAPGGSGLASETHFANDDGMGGFDGLGTLGGTLLQEDGISGMCTETVPPEANLTTIRMTSSTYGAGLIEAIEDSAIEFYALNPPGGVSGQVHMVPVVEEGGAMRVGRFGWKAQYATAQTAAVEMALGSLGLTSPFEPADMAPNGDMVLLAQCDAAVDPEDKQDLGGFYFTERVTDFMRLTAAPPQTPGSNMNGENFFTISGCTNCHVRQFTTPDDPALETALRNVLFKPYSDFLLHDMGDDGGDPIVQGAAGQNEVRTAPLWGVRLREKLWHDGRVVDATFDDRIRSAVAEHAATGSEAIASVNSFNGWPVSIQNQIINFLGSLGRIELDMDGDNDVDADDYPLFTACLFGTYTPNDACIVGDIDRDTDVDVDDLRLFQYLADGSAGAIPTDGGMELRIDPDGSNLALSWGGSCSGTDTDYAIYEGTLGDFASHTAISCGTGGATSTTVNPISEDSYYLVVPTNGYKEGSYGADSSGTPRPQGAPHCLPQSIGSCDP